MKICRGESVSRFCGTVLLLPELKSHKDYFDYFFNKEPRAILYQYGIRV